MKNLNLQRTLCGMLPYGLKMYDANNEIESTLVKISYLNDEEIIYQSLADDNYETYSSDGYDMYPKLFSMEKLFEPCLADSKIPIVELAKIAYKDSGYSNPRIYKEKCYVSSQTSDLEFRFYKLWNCFGHCINGRTEPQGDQLKIFEKLKEWHFNIYGLDKSQYIEKSKS